MGGEYPAPHLTTLLLDKEGKMSTRMARHNRTGLMYKVKGGILYQTNPMKLPDWQKVTAGMGVNQSFLNDINGYFGTDFRMNEFRG